MDTDPLGIYNHFNVGLIKASFNDIGILLFPIDWLTINDIIGNSSSKQFSIRLVGAGSRSQHVWFTDLTISCI